MRINLSLMKPALPRRWKLICAKKPAIRKKVVMRNTWIEKYSTASVVAAVDEVLDDPESRGRWNERDGGVIDDAEQQRAAAHGIERGAAQPGIAEPEFPRLKTHRR